MENIPKNKKIILFDGLCNLCDASVQFIVKRDRKDVFRFVSLQSDLGKKIIKHIAIDQSKIDSIILYQPGKYYYYKPKAVLNIAADLGGVYVLFSIFKIVPKSISDLLYDYIAANRYKWYGKKENCMLPTPQIKAKFL